MIKYIEKYPLISISIIAAIMLLVQLDIPSITIMEARNFITAREMVTENNWLLTTMNGEARYQKPPLPTWLTAISGLIFGINSVFALRLPAALFVLLIGIFSYLLSLKLNLLKQNSLYNGLLAITSFYIIAITNEAPWDIFAHGFMLIGIYFLFQLFQKDKNSWKFALLSSIFIGFSILSKGPVSLYALLLPFLIAYGLIFKYNTLKNNILPLLLTIILLLIIGGWWFLYVRLADPNSFLEIASKETENWSSYNVKPFYYYWNFFIQSGLWAITALISLIYPYLIKRVTHKKAYKFTFWWTITSVILLSLIPEKKARYLMPVLIPLALNTGFYVNYLIENFKRITSKKETFLVYVNFGLIALISFSIPIALYFLLKNELKFYLINYILTALSSIVIGILIIKYLIKKNIKAVFFAIILFIVVLFTIGLPISTALNKNKAYKTINSLHVIEETKNIKAYSINEIAPELLWYYNGYLTNIYKNNQLILPKENQFGLLIMNQDTTKILSELKLKHTVNLVETYNGNVGSKNKERLIRQFYIVSKK